MESISRKVMLYMKTLANCCLKTFQLKKHLNSAHGKQASKSAEYFKSKESCLSLKRVGLDARRAFHQAHFSVEASYVVAIRIAKVKTTYTTAETLVKLCLRNCAKIVLGDGACNTLKWVCPSNDTINIFNINPRMEMLVKWKQSRKFTLKIKVSTLLFCLLRYDVNEWKPWVNPFSCYVYYTKPIDHRANSYTVNIGQIAFHKTSSLKISGGKFKHGDWP